MAAPDAASCCVATLKNKVYSKLNINMLPDKNRSQKLFDLPNKYFFGRRSQKRNNIALLQKEYIWKKI